MSYSNLLRGKNWSSVGSERQLQKMSQLSPSVRSGAEWSQAAGRTLMPLERALYVVWADESQAQFLTESGEDHLLTAPCQLTAKDHLEEVRPAQAMGFVEIYCFTCPEHMQASLNRELVYLTPERCWCGKPSSQHLLSSEIEWTYVCIRMTLYCFINSSNCKCMASLYTYYSGWVWECNPSIEFSRTNSSFSKGKRLCLEIEETE